MQAPLATPDLAALLITLPRHQEDLASGLLWAAGTRGIEVRDGAGAEISLLAYFDRRAALAEELARALAPAGPLSITPVAVAEVDWVARFRAGFQALDAAGFRVVPAWAADAGAAGPRTLVVDPGRAFGTGTHETTRLCLELLAQRAGRAPLGRVADVGCGSGILAVAAAKLAAARVVALDNDPEAVAAARQHASLNSVAVHVALGDGGRALAARCFDLVLANLMAGWLIERRDEIMALCAPRGCLILSGLLDTDLPAVVPVYARDARIHERRQGEWAALLVEPA